MSCNPNASVFDENKVDFTLVSGAEENKEETYQSDAILASAALKSNADPIPLNCTWYNVPVEEHGSRQGLQLIENASGACFQPSIEDIGKKVCVHAMPHDIDVDEDDEGDLGHGQYMGMPLFAEIGPLKLDPKMEQEVDESFQQITEGQDLFAAFKSPRNSADDFDFNQQQEEQPPREKIFKIMSINEMELNGEKQSEDCK